MPIGGKLVLKGGVALKGGVKKKHKKSKAPGEGAAAGAAAEQQEHEQHAEQQHEQHQPQHEEGGDALQPVGDDAGQQPAAADAAPPPGAIKKVEATAINVMSGNSYEQEFELEQQRMKAPKVKSTPWGSSYRAAPEILHGYKEKVTGRTASERLDMRAATKADKFCK